MTGIGGTRIFARAPRILPALAVALAAAAQGVMATVFSLLLAHFETVTLSDALFAALFLWLGFVATTLLVNRRFQGFGWDLPLIEAGHWLFVLLGQGLVLGSV